MYPKLKTFGGITHFQKLLSKGLRESQKEKCRNTVKALEVFSFGLVLFLSWQSAQVTRAGPSHASATCSVRSRMHAGTIREQLS